MAALGPISWSKTVRRSGAAQLAVVHRGAHFLDMRPIGEYHVLVAEGELVVAALADEYGLKDIDGRLPRPLNLDEA